MGGKEISGGQPGQESKNALSRARAEWEAGMPDQVANLDLVREGIGLQGRYMS